MGLETGVGQGFLWAYLRAEEAQEEDQDWLLGSGEGLLGERRDWNEKGTLSQTTHSTSRAADPCLSCLQTFSVCGAQVLSCHLGRFAIPFLTCCLVSAGCRLWLRSWGLWAIPQKA